MTMPVQRLQHYTFRPRALASFAVLLLVASTSDAYNGISVSLQIHNKTSRHQLVNAKLDQSSRSLSWKLDVDLGHLVCASGQEGRQIITIAIKGSELGFQDYSYTPGLGYLWSSTEYLPWPEANATCADRGAVLAMPRNKQEGKKFIGLVNYGNAYPVYEWAWVGTTDYAEEGKWVTEKGIPLEQIGPFEWFTNEPNGGRKENCMVMHSCSGIIGDAPCDWKLPFACQLE